jgi:alpha-galactosidase
MNRSDVEDLIDLTQGKMLEAIEQFEHRHEAQVTVSSRRYRRVKRTTLVEAKAWDENQIEEVKMIEIVMPFDKLEVMLMSHRSVLSKQAAAESRLREECPALQTAWDHYQTMLALLGGQPSKY